MDIVYLIIGASGFIGSYFLKNIIATTNSDIIATYNTDTSILNKRIQWLKLDVANFKEVEEFSKKLAKINKRFKVIYLSAYHHPDKVEENFKFAWNINITALSNIINKIPNLYTFYYSSSDSVYGESLNGYHFKENDQHNPVNKYGQQKSLAEAITLSYGQNVIHYPFLIGPSLCNKKHFYDHIAADLSSGKFVDAFSDSYRSSIDFESASLYTINLIEKYADKNIGTVNICADKALSKYDVILQIANKLGCSTNMVKPILTSEANNIFTTKRANSTLMTNSKLKELLSIDKIEIKL